MNTMKTILVIFLIIPFQISANSNDSDYLLHKQKEKVALNEEALQWEKSCNDKQNFLDCYEYGVHLAQTLNEETKAIPYYQISCDKNYEVACFNLAGIWVKDLSTRPKAVEVLEKTCTAANQPGVSKLKKEVLNPGCEMLSIVRSHMQEPYSKLLPLLKHMQLSYGYGKSQTRRSAEKGDPEIRKEMLQALDKRLLDLKEKDPVAFSAEMNLQKIFNESTVSFCGFYESKCEGTVCKMCAKNCYSLFFSYRKNQADQINTSALTFESKTPKNDLAKKHFQSFADKICELPNSVWKKSTKPQNCSKAVLTDIHMNVISSLVSSEDNEGDVCAQL